MKIIKYSILFFLAIVFVLPIGLFLSSPYFRIVDIDGKKFIAELALYPEKQERGLGGRNNLCGRCAMLFDFKKKDNFSFWMKDMKFDLDIIWVSDGRIVYIKKNFSRKSEEVVIPEFKADKVLEIAAGLSDKYGFKAGDTLKIY